MSKDKSYTAKDIVSLTDREHVRLRTQIYLGSMHPTVFFLPILSESTLKLEEVVFVPAVYKAIGEIIDNSLDEFSHLTIKNKHLKIRANPTTGLYVISDNGRGIPIDKKTELVGKTNKEVWTPELAIARLRAGRNFTNDKEVGVIGQNGVGAACTNFCSTHFEVNIHRDNQHYNQKFADGANKIGKPTIVGATQNNTGTEIIFKLDPAVFTNVALPNSLVRNRAIEIALTNPDITVEYNNEKFKFKKGLQEYIDKIASDKIRFKFEVNEENVQGEIHVICNGHTGIDEQMFTWVNSSLLFDGGKCNTQFFNVLFDRVGTELEKGAKKLKAEVTRNDIRRGLLVLANLKIKNPEYDSQSKTRLTGPDVRKEFINVVDSNWKNFVKSTSTWLNEVLEFAAERHHADENKKAIDEHQKKKRKLVVPGLLDATSSNRQDCQLLITEGLSAKSQISEARNPATTAAFALTGKINNVWGCTPAQVLKMDKLKELLSIIGLTPGRKADRKSLNYGKLVPATDADFDGDDIFTLLVCMFYQWPELFDPKLPPFVYRLVAPNVVAIKGDKRVHFTTRSDYEKAKEKYKGWTIEYMKGLGSMSKKDWEMVLQGTDCLIPIVDDGNLGNTLELLFGSSADMRKAWLTANEE